MCYNYVGSVGKVIYKERLMLITVFSKDSKRGFAAGSNNLTPEKLAAGAITLAAGLVAVALGGLLKRKKSEKSKKKKKPPIWLVALPAVYGTAKSKIERNFIDGLVSEAEKAGDTLGVSVAALPAEEASEGDHGGIEVVDAIPISSEDEVYEHI